MLVGILGSPKDGAIFTKSDHQVIFLHKNKVCLRDVQCGHCSVTGRQTGSRSREAG